MKMKCPKCVSARHVRTTEYNGTYTCTKCQVTFTEDEGFQ